MTSRWLVLASGLVAGVLTLFIAFDQLFSTFARYDDEGYLMLSLVSFLQGHPLYEATFSQYGPAYYAFHGLLHSVTGLPIDHDVARFKTGVQWLLTSGLAAGVVWRLTHHLPLTFSAYLLTFFHLDRLVLEPSHPQELSALAVVGVLFAATHVRGTGDARAWLAISLLGTLLVWTKLNVGGLLWVAVALAVVLQLRDTRLRALALPLLATGAALLPALVGRAHLMTLAGQWPLWLGVAVGLIYMAARSREWPARFDGRALAWLAVPLVLGSLGMLGLTTLHGTSLAGSFHGLVGQHLGFHGRFYIPVEGGGYGLLVAPALVVLAWWAGREGSRARDVAAGLAVGLLLFAGGSDWVQSSEPLRHGLLDRGGAVGLLWTAPLLLWALVPGAGRGEPESAGDADSGFGRSLLAFLGALMPVTAYPVPGTQMALATLPALLGLLVLVADTVQRWQGENGGRALVGRGLRIGVVGVFGLMVVTSLHRADQVRSHRASLTPLDLPGASLLRLPAERVASYRWLVDAIRRHSDTFVFAGASRNSLYFWTQLDPPTALNTTLWTDLLDSDQQREIVRALEGADRPSVVYEPYARTRRDSPLRDYIEAHFEKKLARGDTELWFLSGASAGPQPLNAPVGGTDG
ncbi:hypothetical protein MK489_21580 [Myxococcota bacterium]|nr:hypothetical protein [Myxococcota bacterium]